MTNSIPVLLKPEEMSGELPFEIWLWRGDTVKGLERGGMAEEALGVDDARGLAPTTPSQSGSRASSPLGR